MSGSDRKLERAHGKTCRMFIYTAEQVSQRGVIDRGFRQSNLPATLEILVMAEALRKQPIDMVSLFRPREDHCSIKSAYI